MSSSAQWATFRVYGGNFSNPNQYAEMINLWQLSDSSGNRVMSNYNRWIDLTWGMRFAPDSTGWLEVWVDGQNIYPRKNRPTIGLAPRIVKKSSETAAEITRSGGVSPAARSADSD